MNDTTHGPIDLVEPNPDPTTPTAAAPSPASSASAPRGRFGLAARYAASVAVLVACTLAMSVAAALTLGRARRFYAERIATPAARAVLRVWGIRLEVVGELDPVPGQKVYVSNHTSTIDLFALVALGLPDTRFFLSAYLRKVPPIAVIGTLIGNFWIVTQKRPAERVEIFRAAGEELARTGESVYLSPEGKRVTTGDVGAFNKGAFHLATSLGAPLVPMFIHIPREIDPGLGLAAGAGTVRVHVGAPIPTLTWTLDELLVNKELVRERYVDWHRALHG